MTQLQIYIQRCMLSSLMDLRVKLHLIKKMRYGKEANIQRNAYNNTNRCNVDSVEVTGGVSSYQGRPKLWVGEWSHWRLFVSLSGNNTRTTQTVRDGPRTRFRCFHGSQYSLRTSGPLECGDCAHSHWLSSDFPGKGTC